jgi:ATP-dependent protease ClpP protease subunit
LIGWDVLARDVRAALPKNGSVQIQINSPGGDVYEGFAIYNALRDFKRAGGEVEVVISGLAASMATYISTVGDRVSVEDNAVYMTHNPWTFAMGDHRDMAKAAQTLDSLANVLARGYAARTGADLDEIRAQMDAETWMFGSEIVDAGYADEVFPAGAGPESKADALSLAHGAVASMQAKLKASETEETLDRIAAILPRHSAAVAATPKQEGHMAETKQEPAVNPQPEPKASDVDVRGAIKQRNEIIKSRLDAFMAANPARAADIRACFDAAMADIDQTPEQFTDAVLASLAKAAEPVAGAHSTRVEGMMDEREKFRAGASKWLARRAGLAKDDDRGNPYRGLRLHELAAASLRIQGVKVDGMTASELAGRVLAAHTTSDFPYLLADSARKSLQAAYEAFPSTWSMIAASGSVSDFKTINLMRLGSFSSLAAKPEGAEYVAGTVSEEREQLTASTKGRFIELTREMIINDDLDGFSRMAAMLGRAAARTVNADVYAVINANGTLSNGRALFNTTDGNLAGSGAAISVATLSAGRAAMRKQKDPSGNDYLNIMPRTLLVPVAKEDHAREVVTSTDNTDTTASRKRNPIQDWGPLEIVSDPYLDATSTDAWYLIADPMDVPALEVRFLDGNQTPYIDDTEEFLTDGIRWKVRLDYGVAANDRRGAYKNAGS